MGMHTIACATSGSWRHVKGLGLEDLEGCERFFSKSNALAKPVRYASRFHRQQEITTYIKHFDSFETYTNLSESLIFILFLVKLTWRFRQIPL
jgi:hypothetical protein